MFDANPNIRHYHKCYTNYRFCNTDVTIIDKKSLSEQYSNLVLKNYKSLDDLFSKCEFPFEYTCTCKMSNQTVYSFCNSCIIVLGSSGTHCTDKTVDELFRKMSCIEEYKVEEDIEKKFLDIGSIW